MGNVLAVPGYRMGRAYTAALSTMNAFMIAYMADVHFAMIDTCTAVSAFLLINFETDYGKAAEKTVKSAKRT